MTLAAIYQQPVANLIPHKRGMIWLEAVVDCDDTTLTAIAQVKSANPLYNSARQQLPASAGIEWMAQAVSAFAGIHRLRDGKSILLGFLLGTRRYRSLCGGYALAETATIHVSRSYVEEDLAAFDCTITVANELRAEALITVFQPEDYQSYLLTQDRD